ncbi:MAG: hypothetical protein ABIH42_01805, partial [Planctomycetota bacterium]
VIGTIKTLRSRDPKLHVNCYKGKFEAEIYVLRISDNILVYTKNIVTYYPSGKFEQEFIPIIDKTEEEVLWLLKERAVKEIAELFYPHSPPE